MKGALLILCFTIVVGVILWLLDRRRRSENPDSAVSEPERDDAEGECCGMHITCEKDSLAVLTTDVEYYDDEELDRFAGRDPQDYDDAEIEEFRDVLLTLLPDDIAGWARSLQLRGIQLPAGVREELLMIVAERRAEASGKK